MGEDRPTLIVWGARDSMIPVSHARTAHTAIPGSRLEIFEQAGHFPHQDEPKRFADVLVDFLATTKPAVGDRAQLRQRLARGGHSDADAAESHRRLAAVEDEPVPAAVASEPRSATKRTRPRRPKAE
jgi:hypothetical protein